MTIDPINNIMPLQIQNTPATKPVAPVVSTDPVEVQKPEDAPKIDATTLVVENNQEKGNSGKEDGQEQKNGASREQLKDAVSKFNKQATANTEAVFGIHEGTNRVTIKIVDKNTKDVIKELPPEKTLDMIAKVWEMAGILVDEKR